MTSLGADEQREDRRDKRITAKELYRAAARLDRDYFVKASGLRWVCPMLLMPIPWAGRGHRDKKPIDWARRSPLEVHRRHPERRVVALADSGHAALEILTELVVTTSHMRLDIAPCGPEFPRCPPQDGRPRPNYAGPPTPTTFAAARGSGRHRPPTAICDRGARCRDRDRHPSPTRWRPCGTGRDGGLSTRFLVPRTSFEGSLTPVDRPIETFRYVV